MHSIDKPSIVQRNSAKEFTAPGDPKGPFIRVGRSRGDTGRFIFTALLCLLAAPPAFAEPRVTLDLSTDQVVEIMRLVDSQPISQSPPPAFWTLQESINKALQGDPVAKCAFLQARCAR